jgi:hypothetical protein
VALSQGIVALSQGIVALSQGIVAHGKRIVALSQGIVAHGDCCLPRLGICQRGIDVLFPIECALNDIEPAHNHRESPRHVHWPHS